MADEQASISVNHVKQLIGEAGYEVQALGDGDAFHVRDLESGLTITCVLEDNILFNTLPCYTIPASGLTLELARTLLDADNGISTSSFQLYEMPGGDLRVALTNFCKLQDLGPEDEDDILSCLTFLEVDGVAARQLLAQYL